MDKVLINTLEQIQELVGRALRYAKKESQRMGQLLYLVPNLPEDMKKKKNIRKLRPNLYQGRKMVDGRRMVVYGKTLAEAEQKLKSLDFSVSAPAPATKQTKIVSYGDWLAEFVQVYKKPKLRASSLYQIDVCIRLHIPQWIKEKRVAELSPLDIQKALLEVSSSRMREYTYSVYNESLRKAFQLELIPRPIMEFVESVSHERKQGRALTTDQQRAYLNKISRHPLEKLFKFYLYTGCRRSEALRIRELDVDFANNVLHIPGTKNKYSDRFIPLLSEAKEILLSIDCHGGRYFPYTGNYVTVKQHEIAPDITIKDLRHTFATRCFESGIPVQVYKLWLGHSKQSNVAESVYTHYDAIQQREAAKFTLTPDTDHSTDM